MADTEIIENQETKPGEPDPALKSTNWIAEIKAAEKNLDKWHAQADKIVLRYLDKREVSGEGSNKLNLFTANVLILLSTLYARFPKPIVTREYEDQDDDVARVAATVMERMIKIRPRDEMDAAMRAVVQDRLVPGLGTVWFRYEPIIEPMTVPAVTDPTTGQVLVPEYQGEKKVAEKVHTDYVFWKDFIWSPCRTWADLRWLGRRVKMTRADAKKRFGEIIANQLKYITGSAIVKAAGENPDDNVEYAEIYEIWCKKTRKVYWVCKDFELFCDVKDDLLKLPNFWPCPKPILALHSTSNLVPRPDFLIAQDQYNELDSVNDRITKIEQMIKVVGLVDGNNEEIARIFNEGVDNRLLPTHSFRDFAEKGGFKGAIDWLPIEAMVNALDKLRQYRQDLIQQIYELVGISDIMRGASKASETLGAQQLKAQYGSVKLQYLQMEVASFVEEALEIKASIIREWFDPATIMAESNIEYSNDAQYAQAAIELIKSPAFEMRVEVHADSMAVPEFTAEREGRMGFVRAISEMMTAAGPIIDKEPAAGIAMLRIMQWAAASFRTGNTVESILDQAIATIQKAAENPEPPPPPPPDVVAKTRKDDTQATLNLAKAAEAGANTAAILAEPPEPSEPSAGDQ